MKKVFIGCGITSLIILIVVVYAGYRIYRFAQDIGLQMQGISERYESLNIQMPFSEPVDGLIPPPRFGLWIELRATLSEEMNEMVDSISGFSIQTIFQIREQTFEMADLFAGSLETTGMSPAEYLWITRKVVGVLNSGDAQTNPQMAEIIEAFESLSDDDRNTRNNLDLYSLNEPVTSNQIARTSELLIENKDSFLSSINVFYADMILYNLIKDNHTPDAENEFETTELFSSVDIHGQYLQ